MESFMVPDAEFPSRNDGRGILVQRRAVPERVRERRNRRAGRLEVRNG